MALEGDLHWPDSGLGGECGEGDPNLWEQTDCGLPEPVLVCGPLVSESSHTGCSRDHAAEARVCRAPRGLWVGSPCTLAHMSGCSSRVPGGLHGWMLPGPVNQWPGVAGDSELRSSDCPGSFPEESLCSVWCSDVF